MYDTMLETLGTSIKKAQSEFFNDSKQYALIVYLAIEIGTDLQKSIKHVNVLDYWHDMGVDLLKD